ncbi:MAG: chloride channel protein [Opitutales bacterium]
MANGLVNKFSLWLRGRFSDAQRFLILCIVAGILCGLVGVGFHFSIEFVYHLVFHVSVDPETGEYATIPIWVLVAAPTFGGLIVGLVLDKLAPRAAGSGIPQTKEAYHNHFGLIRIRDGIYRFIVGSISVGMGNSLGREGPTVHICSAVASKIGQAMGLAKSRIQAMVPVGMGAGIAAAFNTPLAAIFFVFEELLGDFSSKALGGLVVAVVVAATVERSILGEHAALQVDTTQFLTDTWMLISLPMGIAAALLGTLFVKSILSLRQKFKDNENIPRWLRPALGGLGVGVIGAGAYLILQQQHIGVFGVGYADLNSALAGSLPFLVLFVLFIGKFGATIVCYSSGASGGIFAPVLFLGSMLGGMFGVPLVYAFNLDTSILAACALLGMGAFFAAVIRCPMTSILIIFEMTRNYSLILPLMAGNILAYFIARRLQPIPIYDALLIQDNVSLKKLPTYRGDKDWKNLPISTITTYETIRIASDLTVREALEGLNGKKHHAYPVMVFNKESNRRELLAMVTHHELIETERINPEKRVSSIIEGQKVVSVYPRASIRDVANTLVVEDKMQVPVVSKTDPKRLIGIVTLHDIARQQNAIEDRFHGQES